jgi:hypothetical protein
VRRTICANSSMVASGPIPPSTPMIFSAISYCPPGP